MSVHFVKKRQSVKKKKITEGKYQTDIKLSPNADSKKKARMRHRTYMYFLLSRMKSLVAKQTQEQQGNKIGGLHFIVNVFCNK